MTQKPRLEFIIPGPPVPYQRVEHARIKTPRGNFLGTRAFVPKESRKYKLAVAAAAQFAAARHPLWHTVLVQKLPVRIHIHVVRAKWLGDIDNLQKNILDGLQESGVIFCNDNRVTQLCASVHTDPRQTPRAEILCETACAELNEPLWMRCAREAGWAPRIVATPEPYDGYPMAGPEGHDG